MLRHPFPPFGYIHDDERTSRKERNSLVTSTSSAQVKKSQKLPKSISVQFPVNGTKSSNRIVPGTEHSLTWPTRVRTAQMSSVRFSGS